MYELINLLQTFDFALMPVMPVTTKAQLGAESEDCVNSLKPRMCEFLSKIKKSAKSRDIPNRSLTPTCGAR
jgi:hypothetical protein